MCRYVYKYLCIYEYSDTCTYVYMHTREKYTCAFVYMRATSAQSSPVQSNVFPCICCCCPLLFYYSLWRQVPQLDGEPCLPP